jgi:signal transduction histidine kinase/CheY-like chemotaxis protein
MSKENSISEEKERLQALHRYHILDTPNELFFDRLVVMAARLFQVPTVLLSFVDEKREWFKARHGFDQNEIERVSGLTSAIIGSRKLYIVSDAKKDSVVQNHPLVKAPFQLRFFAAAPLRTYDGFQIGALCLLDQQERSLDEKEQSHLRDLASLVMEQLELRLAFHNKSRGDAVEKRRIYEKLIQAQKDESLSVLASGIAHDCNNILMAVLGSTDLLKLKVKEGRTSALLNDISLGGQRISDLMKELLAYAGSGKGEVKILDPNDLIKEVLKLAKRTGRAKAKVKTGLEKEIWSIEVDPVQIEQVALNICLNAFEAMDSNGVLTVSTENIQVKKPISLIDESQQIPAGDYVRIAISDTGCGMDEETQLRLFDLFFSTKGGGRGVGMSAALSIIRNHQGYIRVESKVGKGSVFELYFPRSQKTRQVRRSVRSVQSNGDGTILLIEDEAMVRRTVQAILENHGYKVLTAVDGEEGVDLCKKMKKDIEYILLDLELPKLGGAELLQQLSAIHPRAHVILSSGHSRDVFMKNFKTSADLTFLQKPYRSEQLVSLMKSLSQK